jgi:hypothetical protein
LITAKDGQRINAAGLAYKELEWLVANANGIEPFEAVARSGKILVARKSATSNESSQLRLVAYG